MPVGRVGRVMRLARVGRSRRGLFGEWGPVLAVGLALLVWSCWPARVAAAGGAREPAAAEGAAAAPRCDVCGQPLEDDVIEIAGKQIHPGCFRCARCGKPIQGASAEIRTGNEKGFYHPACAEELRPHCAVCGKPLSGDYLRAEGKPYHQACYEEKVAPRCSLCGEVLRGNYFSREDRNYCRQCYERNVAARCVVCGEPVTDPKYPVNFWGEAWHAGCASGVVACDVCGRALGGRGGSEVKPLADGRQLCPHCFAQGITRPDEARDLLDRAAEGIAVLGIRVDTDHLKLALCGKEELQSLSGHWETAGYTSVEKRYANGRLAEQKFTVYVLSHLGEGRFKSVAAHELMHVYLHQHMVGEMPRAVEEGLCNYVGSLMLLGREGDEMARYYLKNMEEDPDPDYGEGYRRVRAYLQRTQLADLVQAIGSGGALPPGL